MVDGLQISPTSIEDLRKLGEAYKAGDKPLQKHIRSSLQASAKQLSSEVIRKGASRMPVRGGLAARLLASRGGVTVSLSGRNPQVSIRATSREGYALRQIDRGEVRHPLFGNRGHWYSQRVPEHAFSDAFKEGAPRVREDLARGIQAALDDIARDAT